MNSKVLFFDLFFTLITPIYNENFNENDILNITVEEWEIIAEDNELYMDRAIGNVKDANTIIDEIITKGKFNADDEAKQIILNLRINRMRDALNNINIIVLNTLMSLKENGYQLCIISNADVIDRMFWEFSSLYQLFDSAIFSCDVGSIKPQSNIYHIAMDRMNVKPIDSIFIGDGGSDELFGAKKCGITTILTEHLLKRDEEKLSKLLVDADYHIKDFSELLELLVHI